MTTEGIDNRGPFAEQTLSVDKRHEGPSEASETRVEVRSLDGAVDEALHAWVQERLGRQLGKYATQIERVEVRFGDENGPKGGIDRACMVHVIVSSLPPIVVEMRAGEDREAFDLAAGRAERALRRSMQKHGFSTRHKGRLRGKHGDSDVETVAAAQADMERAAQADEAEQPLYDKRVGRSNDNLIELQASADGLEAHTATRNTKLNTEGLAYALEDSTAGSPSRTSTRGSKNHMKHDGQLALRTKTAVHSPAQRAQRASRG
jgi:ribosome-associated translation inhibitor RaiA